jgi:histidine triad (HIT) family protein
MNAGCIFCRIADGQIPATLIYKDEDAVAFRDINPQAPVHALVLPRRHFADLPALLAAGEARLAGKLLDVVGQVARDLGLGEQGFRVVVNTGEHGGQTVPHLHLHVLGGRHLGWPPG